MALDLYFWNSLPEYFHLNDTYRDKDPSLNDRGFLERYLLAFQEETEDYVTDIENIKNQIFPDLCEERFLEYIAEFYGNPPDTFGNVGWYRNVLKNIIFVNKYKGTVKGFKRYWEAMETEVTLDVITATPIYYDDGTLYDNPVNYDTTCYPCSTVNITFPDNFAPLNNPPYNDNLKRQIQSILVYLLPINTIVGTFVHGGNPQDIDLGADNLIPIAP